MLRLSIMLFSFLFFSSCIKLALKKNGILENKIKATTINLKNKEILIIPMKHLAQKEFYDNVIMYLKNKEEYEFLVEGTEKKNIVSVATAKDTLAAKKFRKILGYDLVTKYSETENFGLNKIKDKYNLVDQPGYSKLIPKKYTFLGLDGADMIDQYEKERGEIILDSCDISTNLGIKKYNCLKFSKDQKNEFVEKYILDAQNKHVAQGLLNSKSTKIILVYGSKHVKGISKYLKEDDKQ